jgi:hypothetical protein
LDTAALSGVSAAPGVLNNQVPAFGFFDLHLPVVGMLLASTSTVFVALVPCPNLSPPTALIVM